MNKSAKFLAVTLAVTAAASLALISSITFAAASFADDDGEFLYPTAKDYPAVRATGSKAADFVPKGWTIIGQASGDLNGDKVNDTAIVVKASLRKFKQKNQFLGEPIFDTNGRMLIVLFKNKATGALRLAEKCNTIIPIPDSPQMEEPFQTVAIKNEALELGFKVWYSAGTWFSSDSTYKFRYDKGKFVLIGADTSEIQCNSGEQKDYSYNFLSHKMCLRVGSISDDAPDDSKVKWTALPRQPLRPMSAFKTLYEWTVVGDHKL